MTGILAWNSEIKREVVRSLQCTGVHRAKDGVMVKKTDDVVVDIACLSIKGAPEPGTALSGQVQPTGIVTWASSCASRMEIEQASRAILCRALEP